MRIIFCLLVFAAALFFAPNNANAQTFKFECLCTDAVTGDTCDVCTPSSNIAGRSFSGLMIYRYNTATTDYDPYKWIDAPYSIRQKPGQSLEFLEYGTTNPDRITISRTQTEFYTYAGFIDSTWCECNNNRVLFYASDSTNFAPIYTGDTLLMTGWGATTVTFDSILKKYVIYTPTGGGGGSGTVTNFSFTDANGFDGTVTNPTTTPNLTLATTVTGIIYGASGSLNPVTIGSGLMFSAPTLSAVDVSATNELQTYSHSGTTSYTNTLSNSGGSFTLQSGTGIGISHTGGTTTFTNTSPLGTGTENYFPKWGTGGSLLTSTSLLYDDGNEIGLNTTTPFAEFHLNNGDFGAYKNTTGSNGASLFLGDLNYDNSSFFDKAPGLTAVYNSVQGVASDLGFYSYNGSRNLRAILDKEGNFGVGTATPARLLHIAGTARITGSVGTATTITGRDGSGDISNVTVGSGLTLSGGTLSNTATTYSTIQEEGTPLTQQPAINFVGSAYTASNDGANSRTNVTADADVNALADIATTGLYTITGTGTSVTRNMNIANSTAAPGITGSWTNANGVSGNPTLSLDFTGYTWKQYARVVSTTNLTLSGLQTVDGVSLTTNDRILVAGQTTGANNGLYLVTSGAWSRAPEANASAEFSPQGQVYFVTEGTTNGNTFWYLETDNVTLGTTPLVYTKLSGASGSWLLDGNTVTSLKTIGTNDNFDFPIETNGTEKARVTTGGSLLVNTTSALARLHAAGVISSVGILSAGGTGLSSGTALYRATGTFTSGFGYVFDGDATLSGGNVFGRIRNGSNTTDAQAIQNISVAGTTAGDPYTQYQVEGANVWSVGIDNSVAADPFKIARTTALGVSTSDDVFIIETDGRASIGGTPTIATTNLTVAGSGGIRIPAGNIAARPSSTESIIRHNTQNDGLEAQSSDGGWHLVTARTSPTLTVGNAMGTGGTVGATINGSYTNGSITIQTGTTGLINNGTILTVNYPVTFSANPTMILDGANPATMNERAKFYVSNNGQTGSIITANGTLTANTNYILWYIIKN